MEFPLPGKNLEVKKVSEDNTGAIALAENPTRDSNSNHVDPRRHFLRELVENMKIVVEHLYNMQRKTVCRYLDEGITS